MRIKTSQSISTKLARKLGQQEKKKTTQIFLFFPPKELASSFRQAQEMPGGLVTITTDANDGICQGERNVM